MGCIGSTRQCPLGSLILGQVLAMVTLGELL
jgi:hypothetical protein